MAKKGAVSTGAFKLVSTNFTGTLVPSGLVVVVVNIAVKVIINYVPNLSTTVNMTLLLPLAFNVTPRAKLVVLNNVCYNTVFNNSVSTVLVRAPNAPTSTTATLSKCRLAGRKGTNGTLNATYVTSFFNNLLSYVSLCFFTPVLTRLTVGFKDPRCF